jgi:hypothetical protein
MRNEHQGFWAGKAGSGFFVGRWPEDLRGYTTMSLRQGWPRFLRRPLVGAIGISGLHLIALPDRHRLPIAQNERPILLGINYVGDLTAQKPGTILSDKPFILGVQRSILGPLPLNCGRS